MAAPSGQGGDVVRRRRRTRHVRLRRHDRRLHRQQRLRTRRDLLHGLRRLDRHRSGRDHRRHRLAHGGAVVLHPQDALDHLGLGPVAAGDLGEPAAVDRGLVHPVHAAGHAAEQGHGHLGAEAGGEVQGVLHVVGAAAAEVEGAQVRIGLAQVGHGRYDAVLEDLHRDRALDAHAHGVTGEALGVGDHHPAGRVAEGVAQGCHLGRGAAAPGRGVGLVGDEHRVAGHGLAVQAEAALGPGHEVVHHGRQVVRVEPGGVEGAVARLAGQQLGEPAHAPAGHVVGPLHHEGGRPHAQHQAVATAVEGQHGVLDPVVGGCRARGLEAGADPRQQLLAGRIVRADHHHAPAAAGAQPVLGQAQGVVRGGAGGVDRGVGAAGADVLGELAVAHGQDAEQEAAVELVGLAGLFVAQQGAAAGDLVQGGRIAGGLAQRLERVELVAAGLPLEVAPQLAGEAIEAGPGRGEDHARLVP